MAASQQTPYEIFRITSVRLELVLTPSQVWVHTKDLFTQWFHSINIYFQGYQYHKQTSRVNLLCGADPKRTSYFFYLASPVHSCFPYYIFLDGDLARCHKLTEVSLGHWLDARSKPLPSGSFRWVAVKGGSATVIQLRSELPIVWECCDWGLWCGLITRWELNCYKGMRLRITWYIKVSATQIH